ncbi:MAG: lipase family protein [Magnetococcales bacterium]|nr:lipase family protein [Magnetococcales bacterium]
MHIKISATLANIVYRAAPVLNGFEIKKFSDGNIQWLTAVRGRDLWITFAGTNEVADWIDNLDARKDHASYGTFHSGFKRAAISVEQHVVEEVSKQHWDNITLCGHSLGGAVAAILATYLFYYGMNVGAKIHLTTFGQPRCGDDVWASNIKWLSRIPYIRVVNAGDPVPHLPSFLRFRHAGQILFFSEENVMVAPTMTQRLYAAFRAIITNRENMFAMLSAHSMDLYLANILSMQE